MLVNSNGEGMWKIIKSWFTFKVPTNCRCCNKVFKSESEITGIAFVGYGFCKSCASLILKRSSKCG